ncbi:MAG: type II toxin-antitoxin system Phd/YefM family antitoxin [Clostridia bacterium]
MERGDWVAKSKKKGDPPEYRTATEFLRGQASKIFEEVAHEDKVVLVTSHGKPKSVVISYERYKKLKYENDADI